MTSLPSLCGITAFVPGSLFLQVMSRVCLHAARACCSVLSPCQRFILRAGICIRYYLYSTGKISQKHCECLDDLINLTCTWVSQMVQYKACWMFPNTQREQATACHRAIWRQKINFPGIDTKLWLPCPCVHRGLPCPCVHRGCISLRLKTSARCGRALSSSSHANPAPQSRSGIHAERENNLYYTSFKTMNHHRWHLAVSWEGKCIHAYMHTEKLLVVRFAKHVHTCIHTCIHSTHWYCSNPCFQGSPRVPDVCIHLCLDTNIYKYTQIVSKARHFSQTYTYTYA